MGALLKILVILLALAGGGGAYVYTSYVKPLSALQVQPAGVEPISMDPMVLRVSVDIVNPGKPVRLPGADMNLYIGDKFIGKGKLSSEVVQSGSTRLYADITLDKDAMMEIMGTSGGEQQMFVDGTLYLKVLSFNLKVPIPRVPVPGGLDISALAAGEASALAEIMPLLMEYRGQKLGDVLVSEDFKRKYKERTGEDLTEAEIQEIIQTFGKEALDKTIDELMAGGYMQ